MVKIMETILRDAHQSLIATRMRTQDMIPVLEHLDRVGYHALEMWGGATFDVTMRFLNENPWERLRTIRKHIKNTKLQMLLRGQNLVGYRHYADDVVDRFVELAAKNGIDVFRIFDALNDVRNMERAIVAAKKTGKHVQGTISYTVSPVHTIDKFMAFAKELKDLEVDSIAIKDMAGLLTPKAATELVSRLKKELGFVVEVHTHSTSGLAYLTYMAAIEAGADIVDTALSPFGWGTAQPPTEPLVYALHGTEYDTGIDPENLKPVTAHFREVRKKYEALIKPQSERVDIDVLVYQIPGGMLSNLLSQLEKQKKLDKYGDVLKEVPRVREDLGFPPLVTPTSQIVGTQAVMNVIAGERYKMVTKETREYVRGMYGRTPAPVKPEIMEMILKGEKPISGRPADQLSPELPEVRKKFADLIKEPEDEMILALYPDVGARFLRGEIKAEEIPSARPAQAAAGASKAPAPAAGQATAHGVYDVVIGGRKYTVEVMPAGQAPQSAAAAPAAQPAASAGGREVPSPLQGTILKILVSAGDRVEAGQKIAVIEAMKMENDITAPEAGTVAAVLVKEGDMVEADQPIMVLN